MPQIVSNNKSFLCMFDAFTRKVNKLFTRISGILVLLIAIIIFQDVIRRYILNDPSSWSLDLCGFLLVYVVFLSISPTLESGNHVSVDLINEILSEKMQKIFKNIVYLLIIVFGIVFFMKILNYTINIAASNRISTSNIPIPLIYVYFIAPIGVFQFILTAINLYLNLLFEKKAV